MAQAQAQARWATCTSPAEVIPYAADLLAGADPGEEWCVVVPRARLARLLRARLLERPEIRGWTGPRVLTLEQTLAHFTRHVAGMPALTPIQSRQLIASLIVEANRESGGASFRGQVVDGRVADATLRAMVHLFDELEPHNLSAEELRDRLLRGRDTTAVSERAREVVALYEAYRSRLESEGLRGPLGEAVLAAEAARTQCPPEGARRFLFLGFDGSGLRDVGVRLMFALAHNKEVAEVRALVVRPDGLEGAAWSCHGNDPLVRLWNEEDGRHEVVPPGFSTTSRPADLTALALDPSAYRLEQVSHQGGVEIVRVPDTQIETEWVASDIKRRVLDESLSPDDVAIVARDMGRRAPDFERSLRRMGVPVVASWEQRAEEIPAVRALRIAYMLMAFGWRPRDVIAAAESPYLPLDLNPTLLAKIGGSGTAPRTASEWIERIRRAREQASSEAEGRADLPADLQARLADEYAMLEAGFLRLVEDLAGVFGERANLPPTAWVESLSQLLGLWKFEDRIYEMSSATSPLARAELVRSDLDGLNALLKIAQDWSRGRQIAGLGESTMDAREWAEEFDVMAREATVRSSTYPHESVQLLDPVQAALGCWKIVYVTGLVEGVFPAGHETGTHSLSDAERSALNLPTAEERAARERLYFHLVAATAAERLILVTPSADERGKALVASAFVTCLPLRIEGVPVREVTARSMLPRHEADLRSSADVDLLAAERLRNKETDPLIEAWLSRKTTQRAARAWKASRARQMVAAAQLQGRSARSIEGAAHAGVLPEGALPESIAGPEAAFSPSELETFDRCHFRFFATRLLGLHSGPDGDEDHDEAAAFGTLQHRILEALYRELASQGQLPPRTESEIEAALLRLEDVARAKVSEHAASAHERLWELDLTFLLDVLRLFVRRDLTGMLEAEANDGEPHLRTRVRALEEAVGTASQPIDIEAHGEKFRLRGRLDRVESIEDARFPEKVQGTLLVRDYKSTRSPWRTKPESYVEGKSIQLPLYGVMAERHFGKRVFGIGELRTSQTGDPEPLLTRDIRRDGQGGVRLEKTHRLGKDPIRQAGEAALDVAGTLVAQIRTGNFAPQPGRNCFGCPLKDVCRAAQMADPARMRERAQMPLAVERLEMEEARHKAATNETDSA